jgi:hypothetical protein
MRGEAGSARVTLLGASKRRTANLVIRNPCERAPDPRSLQSEEAKSVALYASANEVAPATSEAQDARPTHVQLLLLG